MFMPSPESLSPHFHSVESLKASLPEKHRHLFDALLQDIKDYCASHDLPFHLLSSSEAFTKAVGPIHPSLLEPLKLRMERLAHLIKHKEPMPEEREMTEQYAREIMGRNFLGTKEVEEYFGKLSPEQQEALSIIPFSKETLESCKDTHILVADIGLSIMGLKKLESCKGLLAYREDWSKFLESIVTGKDQPSWRLIRKTPIENSFNKGWKRQQTLLNPQTDEIPLARQVIYTTILHFLATGERLFETFYVRTNDRRPNKYNISVEKIYGVAVGFFDENGFDIVLRHPRDLCSDTGVASARKALNLEP
jgi:hypothetical protein